MIEISLMVLTPLMIGFLFKDLLSPIALKKLHLWALWRLSRLPKDMRLESYYGYKGDYENEESILLKYRMSVSSIIRTRNIYAPKIKKPAP